jgi:hypothetical protein
VKSTPDTRKEVYAWFGAAAYQVQCFEVELRILLIFTQRLQNPKVKRSDVEALDTRLTTANLGFLLRELKKHMRLPPDFESLLDQYRKKRNYLMHHFFYEHSFDLATESGCQKMISELKDLHGMLEVADEIAQTMSRLIRKHLKWSEEKLDVFFRATLKRETSVDLDEEAPNKPFECDS